MAASAIMLMTIQRPRDDPEYNFKVREHSTWVYVKFSWVVVLQSQAWARREALARMKIREEGGEVEFGKYYSEQHKFEEPELHDDDQ